MKQRIEQVDILRMMAMLLVMYQHANGPFSLYILAFHMPIFFIITGFTFAISDSWKKIKFKDFIIKRAKVILVANYSFIVINIVFNILIGTFTDQSFSLSIKTLFLLGGNSTGLLPMTFWFLPILFFADVFFFIALKSMGNVTYYTLTSILFSYVLTKTAPFSTLLISSQLSMIFMGTFFIGVGYLFSKQRYKLITGKHKLIVNVCLSIISLVGLILFVNLNYSPFYMFMNSYGSYPWAILGALSGSLFLMSIIRFLPNYRLMNRFLIWGGQNTLSLFPIHVTLLAGMVYLENKIQFTPDFLWLYNLITLCLISFTVAWVIEKYLPFLIGRKK